MKFLISLSALIFLNSCASSLDMPRREIDRPYTLPAGNHEVDSAGMVSFRKNETRSPSHYTDYNWGLGGGLALSRDATLEFSPLPMGLRFQLINDADNRLGFSVGSPLNYSAAGNLMLMPQVRVNHLRRLSANFGWNTDLAYGRTYDLDDSGSNGYSARFSTGPLFQLGETTAITLGVGMYRTSLISSTTSISLAGVERSSKNVGTVTNIPVSASFDWSVKPDSVIGITVSTGLWNRPNTMRDTSIAIFTRGFFGRG